MNTLKSTCIFLSISDSGDKIAIDKLGAVVCRENSHVLRAVQNEWSMLAAKVVYRVSAMVLSYSPVVLSNGWIKRHPSLLSKVFP